MIFVAASLEELLAGGRVLVDPNTFSDDGTSSLTSLTVSADGQLVAYGVSEAGSDWATFQLLSLATGDAVDDALIQTKFSQAEWLPDDRSYVYTHFDHEGHAGRHPDGRAGRTQAAAASHRRAQDHDELIMEFPENDQLIFWAEVTDDDRYLVVSIVEGTENRNRLWVYPIITGRAQRARAARSRSSTRPVAEFVLAGSDGATLYLRTDLEAEARAAGRCRSGRFPGDWTGPLAGGGRRVRTHAAGREGSRRRIHPGLPGRRAAAGHPVRPGRCIGSECRRGRRCGASG